LNAYLHIPFCTSICSYCDFTSFAGQEGKMSAYVDALCQEVASSSLTDSLETIYFGGGTPSLLLPEKLEQILKVLRVKAGFDSLAEISMEANPETVDRERLQSYRALGVNRLSFGAQAFQKEILKRLGRGHEWDRVEKAFAEARQAGFDNINLDLMFGLYGQTLGMFQESLRQAVSLNPEHLSLYALQVEEGTPLAKQVAEGLPLPIEDEVADEYAWAQEFLAQNGYEQYEVSNFAKPGKACRHNWNIWRGEDYWGFGLSAVGTVGGSRHSHGDNLEDYIQNRKKRLEKDIQFEVLTPEIRLFEKVMLGLRTAKGVSLRELKKISNNKFERIEKLEKEGLFSRFQGNVRVTNHGFFLLNGILNFLRA
jgi:oxygen-independent coproporphyrinogen III oxidase